MKTLRLAVVSYPDSPWEMALCQKRLQVKVLQSTKKKETSAYVSDVLPGLLERYDANDIYNVDETGLFYKLLPDN